MNRLSILTLSTIGLLAVATAAMGDFRLERSFEGDPGADFRLRSGRGSVRVVGTSESTINVIVTADREDILDHIGLEFEAGPSGVEVIGKLERETRFFDWLTWYRYQGLHFEVQVPRHSNVTVETRGARAEVEGIDGSVEVRSSGASVRAFDIRGDVAANTRGASATVEKVEGDVQITTSGALIRATDITGNLEAHTRGARVVIEDIGGNVSASTRGARVYHSGIAGNVEISD